MFADPLHLSQHQRTLPSPPLSSSCSSRRSARFKTSNPCNHRNQQYSIIGLTNAAGTLVERYSYTAYGTLGIYDPSGTVRTASTYANRYTYTGREYDPDLNHYHFRARWYDPSNGAFISRDPLGYVDGTSLYRGYFGVKMLDPSGLSTVRWTTGAGGPKDVGENAVCCLRAEVFWKENGFASEGECYSECTGWVTTGATAVAGAGGIFEAYLGRSPHASVAIVFLGLVMT
ncbi:MAG: RHS repeat-associated core domain-containing protein [Planctomycetaceae bacterium]|nr:RHS repeat-associated core domain-containing protein [Planctomycetaceae bacterium]